MFNDILNEAYYGKNPVLIECEKLMDDAIKSSDNDIRKKKVKLVENKLKKLFNFNTLTLSTIPVSLGLTLPITTYKFKYVFSKIEMEKSEIGGIQFKTADKVDAIIFIDITRFSVYKYTGEEAIGIILHEIGHSMRTILPSSFVVGSVVAVASAISIVPAFLINVASTPVTKFISNIDSFISEYFKSITSYISIVKERVDAYLLINKLAQRINNLIDAKNVSFKTLYPSLVKKLSKANLINNIIGVINGVFRYKEEVLSDVISASYGYGPALLSALNKYKSGTETIILDNPVIRLYTLPFNIINLAFNPHPSNVSRMILIIDKLEADLKNTIDKDGYKLISEDIEEARKVLNDYKNTIAKSKIRNIDLILYQKMMDKLLKGHTDIRATFMGLTPSDMKYIDGLEKLPVEINEDMSLQECSSILSELSRYTNNDKKIITDFICM